jgi:ComF family protein
MIMAAWIMNSRLQKIESFARTLSVYCLDLLFPPRCVYCRTIGSRICQDCLRDIPWIDTSSLCPDCGLPQGDRYSHTCIDPSRLKFVRSAAEYSGPMRKALHALKYDLDRSIADQLVDLSFSHWIVPTWRFDVLIPVPLGKNRERMRGFNQSLLLAQALSTRIGIPMHAECLTRVRETPSQVGLSSAARKVNMADAFQAVSVEGKSVLLVDDICTTAATLQSCAASLIQAGASGVGAVTLARALPPEFHRESQSLDVGGKS